MRKHELMEYFTGLIRGLFDDQVADALIGSHPQMLEETARQLDKRHGGDQDAMKADVEKVAATVAEDRGLADWLIDSAENPTGWFFRQLDDLAKVGA